MTARTALDTIAITAREALDEMRRILSVLRTSRCDGEPERDDSAPGLDRLERLVERVRRAGVPVELVITGTRRQLTEGQDQCAYRVVQESLTNVIKHAGPASVTVALRYGETDLIASVTDDGRSSASTAEEDPSGHGLMGMRERARIYGGTLIAGRRDDGGFEVVLSLPTGRHCGGAGSA
jgi:signal transduction histidine kinase